MDVSVIIPTLESPVLGRVLDAILMQDEVETLKCVIIVGKQSERFYADNPLIHYIETDKPVNAAIARNLGISNIDADLYLLLDSDCVPVTGWLQQHIAAHENGRLAVSGSVLPTGDTYWQLVYNLSIFHEIMATEVAGPRDFLATLNLSIHKSVIETVGVMNPAIDRVEDVDWTTRMRKAGIQPYFWPYAAVEHVHNRLDFWSTWRYCALSGYQMRRLRLNYQGWLKAPLVLRFPFLVLLLSPFIALWATMRIVVRRPSLMKQYWYTLPAIYLTKIAWCWGASRQNSPFDNELPI